MDELIILFGAELTYIYFIFGEYILTINKGEATPSFDIPRFSKTSNMKYDEYLGRTIYNYIKLPPNEYGSLALVDLKTDDPDFEFNEDEKDYDRVKHILVKLSPKAVQAYGPIIQKNKHLSLLHIDEIYNSEVIDIGDERVKNFVYSVLYSENYKGQMMKEIMEETDE